MNGMNVSTARGAICSAIAGHCASMGPAAISMRQSNAMASSCSTTKSGVMPQMCALKTRIAAATLFEMQQRKMPGVVIMDRPSAGREQREESLQAREPFPHAALADEDVGEGVLRPRVSRLDAERAFRKRLGGDGVAAQLAGERRHREKIRIARVRAFETAHVRAKSRAHILLAKHVIDELRDL